MSNQLTTDFKDFIRIMQANDVEFLICGGHAVGFHGYPRLTMDFDILINPSESNAKRVMKALDDFGFRSAGLSQSLFESEGTAVTLGAQPNQIDLLTSVSKQATNEVFENAVKGNLAEFNVLFISKKDLIRAKEDAGRPKDLADIDELNKI